jgi:hypothetical protein
MWGHLLSSESGVALLSSYLKKHGHPFPIRPLSTVTRLGSTAMRESNQAPTCSIFIGGGTASVVPWQMGVSCCGGRCPVTVLRIFLQEPYLGHPD